MLFENKMFRTIFNPEEQLWSGMAQPSLYNPKISLGHVLLRAMKSNSQKTAQISADSNIQLTYGELYTKSVRAAQNIQKLNYKKGDVFAVISKNNHDLAPIVIALLSTGYPFNTLDPVFTETEMAHMLSLTKPKLVFTEVDSYAVVKQSLLQSNNDATIFTFFGQVGDSLSVDDLFAETGKESDFVPVDVDGENETAIIVCSSGTTGLAKGVCMTHAAILDPITRGFETPSTSVCLCFSSLYWLSGVIFLVVGTLNSATRIITTEIFSPGLLLRLIEQYRATHIMSASHHLTLAAKSEDLLRRDLSSVKNWIVGGSKVPRASCVQMNKFLPNGAINVGYGMSEVAGLIAFNDPYRDTEAVGKLVSGIQIKIVEENGKRLSIGQSGEICVKTVYKFGGYYGNQENTDALFDSEGFIQTGDIGHIDAEGLLHITDRRKEFLKYRNYMISPSEIENVLIACPRIASVCVVGIPDIVSGDLPAAVIVRNTNSRITAEEIKEMVASNFNDSRKLRGGVYFVDSLPTTPSGKVLRREVKKIAAELNESSASN